MILESEENPPRSSLASQQSFCTKPPAFASFESDRVKPKVLVNGVQFQKWSDYTDLTLVSPFLSGENTCWWVRFAI